MPLIHHHLNHRAPFLTFRRVITRQLQTHQQFFFGSKNIRFIFFTFFSSWYVALWFKCDGSLSLHFFLMFILHPASWWPCTNMLTQCQAFTHRLALKQRAKCGIYGTSQKDTSQYGSFSLLHKRNKTLCFVLNLCTPVSWSIFFLSRSFDDLLPFAVINPNGYEWKHTYVNMMCKLFLFHDILDF